MSIAVLLADMSCSATDMACPVTKAVPQEEMIRQIYQTAQNMPSGGLRLILIISIISLVGIIWLVHRQQKLARNQVKIAAMLEKMADQSGK